MLTRRDFCQSIAVAAAGLALRPAFAASAFKLNYIVSSPMYGYAPLAEVLPEVPKTGTVYIDLWPKVHGNQREQLDEMGVDKFRALLQSTGTKLGGTTRYDLGPLKLAEEMALVKKLGGSVIVTGAKGPKDVKGEEARKAIAVFIEQLKPHAEEAAKQGVLIAVENHAGSVLSSPDSILYFAEYARVTPSVGIAFAPHHLPQDGELQGKLAHECGPAIKFLYAQQQGQGSRKVQPIDDELQQLPGRGPLDFGPIVRALAKHNFTGFTSIYMHPFPRGRFILPTHAQVTAEINKSRAYLDKFAAGI